MHVRMAIPIPCLLVHVVHVLTGIIWASGVQRNHASPLLFSAPVGARMHVHS